VTASKIAEQAYVSREHGSGTREVIDEFFKANGVNPDDLAIQMELGSREAIKGAVEAGLGVAVMSASTVVKELQLGSLVAVPLDPPLTRQLSLVYAPEKFRGKLLNAFIEFVARKFAQCSVGEPPAKRVTRGRSRA
jgi:DNA-binding transcriptional LysR family regulator